MARQSPGPGGEPAAVMPRLEALPFANIEWGRFEGFCTDFISALPNVVEAHKYGTRGDDQEGIDIYADLKSGDRHSFQCRHVKRFGKTAAESTIDETEFEAAKHYIVTTCVVTAETRRTVMRHAGWDIWDAEDVSRKIRELDQNIARRLVDTHFGPGIVRDFLGLEPTTAFLDTDDYFRHLMSEGRLFHHRWGFVGRTEDISSLNAFMDSSDQRVLILSGRGGIGKTKLAKEFLAQLKDRSPQWHQRVVADGIDIAPGTFDELPIGERVILVDDAHRREDLKVLLSAARQAASETKLVLVARPYGLDSIRALLTQAGFDMREVIQTPEVTDMSLDELKSLAAESLGPDNAHLVDRLATATRDCPLLTVVGGELIRTKAITPEVLEPDEDLRSVLLDRFEDVIVGRLGEGLDELFVRDVLKLVSATQPVRPDNEDVLRAASTFLGREPHELVSTLGSLEGAGVLIRRGRSFRILPDVLADHLLHRACLTPQKAPTRYGEAVFGAFSGICGPEVLRNLAELDWRLRTSGEETTLLDSIWSEIESQFRDESHAGRCRLLQALERVAYFQPTRMLALIELAIAEPSTVEQDAESAKWRVYSHEDVLEKLPKHLRYIGYTPAFLPRCLDLLWHLGRADTRETNPRPHHAMRILADIAGYDIGKPIWVNESTLAAAERWLNEPDAHTQAHSPLDVIDPLLAKGGATTTSERIKLVFHPFAVSRENTRHIRERAARIILEEAHSADGRIAVRGLESVATALHEPMGEFGREVPDAEKLLWEDDSLVLLNGVSDLLDATPHVALKLRDLLSWHCEHAASTAVRERAQEIRAGIELTFDRKVALLVTKPWSFDKLDHWEAGDLDYEARHESAAIAARGLAKEFASRYPNPAEGLGDFVDRIQEAERIGERVEPGQLLFRIGEVDPPYAEKLAALIIDGEITSLAGSVHALLVGIRKANPEAALATAAKALESAEPMIRSAVGNAYAGSWTDSIQEQDERFLERLLDDSDSNVRLSGLRALRRLATTAQDVVARLCLSVELGGNGTLAEELYGVFGDPYGLPLDVFDDAQLDALIDKMEAVPSLDGYQAQEFLAEVGRRRVKSVIELLVRRLNYADSDGYQPIPYHFHVDLSPIRTSPDYVEALRSVRDTALGATGSSVWWVARLFSAIAGDFTDQNVQFVLYEWIEEGGAERLETVGLLVSDAPSAFVLDHPEFVGRLLSAARDVSENCLRDTGSHLASSAISGGGSRAFGSPAVEDVSRRDRAEELAARFPEGSPTCSFYEDLVSYSNQSIADTLARDEEYLADDG